MKERKLRATEILLNVLSMRKSLFVFSILLLGLNQFGYNQSNFVDSCFSKSLQQPCGKLLKQNAQLWKADSLASNGFRKYFGKAVLAKCDCFVGIKWEVISEYLGKPNFELDGAKFGYPGQKMFRYIMYSTDGLENYQNPGSLRLDVIVLEGKIIQFNFFESDG